MAGPELLLGIAGLLTPLLAAPIESAIRTRFHKPRYNYYSDREEVCGHFIESWTSLHSSVLRLLSIIQTLAHDDQDRRLVLKELERATKVFQDVNAHMLACKPIGNAFREQEKTDMFLETIGKKIGATGIIADEKIAMILGSIFTAKLSSPVSPNTRTAADRNSQSMGYGNSGFCDEGFFESSQPPQLSRNTSSSSGKRDNKHSRNATSHYDCDGSPTHCYKKSYHSSPSPSPSSSFYGSCSQNSLRDSPSRYERYLG